MSVDRADQPIATAEAPPPPEAPEGGGAIGPHGRVAGRGQAIVLLAGSCLPIMGTLLIAPIIPDLQNAFKGVAGVEALAPMTLAIPAVAVGLLAPFAGRIIDRVGRLRLMLYALPLYVVAGTAPLWLNSLPAILASRFLLGVAEAAIMTSCVTLLGDYYSGKSRDRYLSLQAVVAAFSAVLFLAVGGALGENGWRTPFWIYLIGLIFLPLMWRLLWSPTVKSTEGLADGLVGVPWKRLAPLLVITFLGAIVFYALQVELSYVLDDLHVGSAGKGASAALANLGLALAAVVFGLYNRGKANAWLVVAFFLAGIGLILLSLGNNWLAVTGGAVVAGVGSGFMLPALLISTTSLLSFEQRGRGTGAWTGTFFVGQFFSPLAVNGLKAATGELTTAVEIIGVFGIVMGVVAVFFVRRRSLTTNSALSQAEALASVEAVEPPLPIFEVPETGSGTAASTVADSAVVADTEVAAAEPVAEASETADAEDAEVAAAEAEVAVIEAEVAEAEAVAEAEESTEDTVVEVVEVLVVEPEAGEVEDVIEVVAIEVPVDTADADEAAIADEPVAVVSVAVAVAVAGEESVVSEELVVEEPTVAEPDVAEPVTVVEPVAAEEPVVAEEKKPAKAGRTRRARA